MTYKPATGRRFPGLCVHAKATTATLRTHLVHVPARIARSARRIILHLPHNRPWQHAWANLFDPVHDPPR